MAMAVEIPGSEYDAVAKLAQDVLVDYGFSMFPIDVFALARRLGANLIPYSSLSEEQRKKLSEKPAAEKGFTVARVRSDGSVVYDLYYNDNMTESACRYTVAHEIKHIVSGDALKSDGELTETDEQLADHFAKCLLAPQPIIITCGLCDLREYMKYFGLSYTAATYWRQTTEKRKSKYGDDCLFDHEKEFLKRLRQCANITRARQKRA